MTAVLVCIIALEVVSIAILLAVAVPMMIDTGRIMRDTQRVLDGLPDLPQRSQDRWLYRYCSWLSRNVPGL